MKNNINNLGISLRKATGRAIRYIFFAKKQKRIPLLSLMQKIQVQDSHRIKQNKKRVESKYLFNISPFHFGFSRNDVMNTFANFVKKTLQTLLKIICDNQLNLRENKSIQLIVFSIFLTVNINAQDNLNNYLKLAGKNNTELKAKYIEYQIALEDVDGVGSLPDPSVSFGYFVSPVETRLGPQQFKLSATQMFPWFGTLSSKEEVAAKKAEAKFKTFENYRNSLYFNVRSSYYKLYEWQENVEFRTDFLYDLDLLRTLVLQKYKTGGRMSDVLLLDIKIEGAKMQLSSVEDQKSSVISNFTQWLNADSELAVSIPDTLIPQEMFLDGIVDSLLVNNLLLNQKDLDIEASNIQVKVANKSAGPQIGLGLDYVNVRKRTDVTNLDGNGQDVLMPMVTVTIPIFNSRKSADKKIAQLNVLKYKLEKEQLEFTLKSALETAIFNYSDAIRKQDLAQRQLELAEQTRSLIVNEYSTGKADIQELIDIYQKILNYKFAFAKAVTQRNIAVAYLYNLVNSNGSKFETESTK